MHRLIKDPLVHFLALGAGMFALLGWLEGPGDGERERIVIDAAQVEQIRRGAMLLRGGEPTAAELEELLEPVIREQVLYREARALGLDRNDETVRLRLVEKMSFLTQDLVEPEPPDERTLLEFYASNPARFEIPAHVTFEQIYFSPRERGEAASAEALEALEALDGGAPRDGFGDRSPLQPRYDRATRDRVQVLFGDALTQALFGADPGAWEGPFESDFGLHLTRLLAREQARQPAFEEARDVVLEAWLAERRREANEAEYRRMRARYDIVIEQPASAEAADGA